jgi:hypothetical protein
MFPKSAIRILRSFPNCSQYAQRHGQDWYEVELNKQGAGTIMMLELGVTYDSMFDDTGKQMTEKISLWRWSHLCRLRTPHKRERIWIPSFHDNLGCHSSVHNLDSVFLGPLWTWGGSFARGRLLHGHVGSSIGTQTIACHARPVP